jgi:hypothetical protein
MKTPELKECIGNSSLVERINAAIMSTPGQPEPFGGSYILKAGYLSQELYDKVIELADKADALIEDIPKREHDGKYTGLDLVQTRPSIKYDVNLHYLILKGVPSDNYRARLALCQKILTNEGINAFLQLYAERTLVESGWVEVELIKRDHPPIPSIGVYYDLLYLLPEDEQFKPCSPKKPKSQ